MRRRLSSERGVALTVAIFTLAVIALFSALVASSAVRLGDTSNKDRDQKRALGAAEAGLNTALHRVNSLTSPLDNLGCLTDVEVAVLAQATQYVTAGATVNVKAGSCPGAQGRAGNGGEWLYFITLLNNGQHCDQQYTTQTQVNDLLSLSAGGISVLRRCITSFGAVNGTLRRVQREVYSEFRLFNGLIGTDKVHLQPNANAGTSHVGSNLDVTMDPGSLYAGQIQVQDNATVNVQATGQWGVTRRPEPWIIDPLNIDVTGKPVPSANCLLPLLLCNAWDTGGASGRRLKVDTGETVALNPGDYYLCGLNVNGGTLQITGTVKIFLDKDCAAGLGIFEFHGGLLNTVGVVANSNMQIYVEAPNAITIDGGALVAQANLALFAPNAPVTVQKGGALVAPIVKGSISAKEITLGSDVTFVGDPLLDVLSPFQQIAGDWKPGRWSECRNQPTTDDPHSGCVN